MLSVEIFEFEASPEIALTRMALQTCGNLRAHPDSIFMSSLTIRIKVCS